MTETTAVGGMEVAACFRCGDPGRSRFSTGRYGVRECPDCGIVFISPRLDMDGRSQLYDDAGYFEGSVYSGDGAPGESGMATWLQRRWANGRLTTLADYRGTEPDGALLEVGCAYGLFSRHAMDVGWDVTAMDVSAAAVTHTAAALGIDVHRGLLDDAPFDDRAFDVVAAWDVIEHVPDPMAFARRAHDLLVPGGTVALSLPNVASWPARLLGPRWWSLRPDEHIWHLAPATISTVLTEAGFERIALTDSPLAAGNLGRLDSMLVMATRPT